MSSRQQGYRRGLEEREGIGSSVLAVRFEGKGDVWCRSKVEVGIAQGEDRGKWCKRRKRRAM